MCDFKDNGKQVCQGTCNGQPKKNCPALQIMKVAQTPIIDKTLTSTPTPNVTTHNIA